MNRTTVARFPYSGTHKIEVELHHFAHLPEVSPHHKHGCPEGKGEEEMCQDEMLCCLVLDIHGKWKTHVQEGYSYMGGQTAKDKGSLIVGLVAVVAGDVVVAGTDLIFHAEGMTISVASAGTAVGVGATPAVVAHSVDHLHVGSSSRGRWQIISIVIIGASNADLRHPPAKMEQEPEVYTNADQVWHISWRDVGQVNDELGGRRKVPVNLIIHLGNPKISDDEEGGCDNGQAHQEEDPDSREGDGLEFIHVDLFRVIRDNKVISAATHLSY